MSEERISELNRIIREKDVALFNAGVECGEQFMEIERLKAENALLKEQLRVAILNLARVAIEGGDET